jgi:glycosyltransferase involved in cell wall biosynthesis
MSKIRLLCCIHDFRGRGAEKVLATLLERLDRNRFDIGLFVFHDLYSISISDDIEIVSAHIPPTPPAAGLIAMFRANIRKVLAFRKAVRLFRPDVALSVAGTNIALLLTRLVSNRSFKVVLSEHSMPSATLDDIKSRLVRSFTLLITKITYRRADLIITPAELVQKELNALFGVPIEKILVIRNPMDIEKIQAASREEVVFPPLPKDPFVVGFIGSLTPEKDVRTLLTGFSLLRKNDAGGRLMFVGEGPERPGLEALARALGIADSVFFTGFQRNPYPFLARFNVFVLSSRYEVFPNVIIEALTCGVPVISSAWRGSDWIYRDGEQCLFFPIGDSEELGQALLRLRKDAGLRTTLVKNSQEIVQQCAAGSVMERYQAAIAGLLPSRPGV